MKNKKSVTTIECRKMVDFTTFIYFPEQYSAEKTKWPAIIFLHGKDELGKTYDVLPDGGLHNYIQKNSIPLVVIEPQCPADSEWIFQIDALNEFTKKMISEYNLDSSQIYLTGLSMGAIGTWHFGISYPDVFAALLPISGGTYPFLGYPEVVIRLKDVPVWTFHGIDDDVLPISLTKVLVDILLKVNGKIRYTYYENTSHDAWTKTYTNKEIYNWLLSNKKKE